MSTWSALFIALAIGVGGLFPCWSAETLLLPAQSTWRFSRGTQAPSANDPVGWTLPAFNDTSWETGNATFFYGESGFTGTELADMSGRYTTLFLRQRFNVNRPADWQSLELRVRCDDGFVAYLNGTRIASERAEASDPRFDSVATDSAPEPIAFQVYPIENLGPLVAGENVLAVVVLNSSLTSSDLVFDAELVANPKAQSAPTITSVTPPPGLVTNLTQITVVFSEPVVGVEAAHFLVNGNASSQVSGSGTTYTFTFPQPGLGPVGISWGTLHSIRDLETPPTPFSATAPGSTWAYERLDPAGPQVSLTRPSPGTWLHRLGAVEITFNQPVMGVKASDLLLNGQPATQVSGIGAGPYRFDFATEAPAGTANLTWNLQHQITSEEPVPHSFTGAAWTYPIDPSLAAPTVVINEVLADNLSGRKDEDDDPEDWIELWNPGSTAVNLTGWALSDGSAAEDEWVLPPVMIPARGYLLVWASGKDRPGTGPRRELHTHFKLNPNGDHLRLLTPELPRTVVDEVTFGPQGADFSYGRFLGGETNVWRYFAVPSPGKVNGISSITNQTAPVHFSVERGFYDTPFRLSLACDTPGAVIRYTTNGSPPVAPNGVVYSEPILINSTRVLRAAAVAPDQLPSAIRTHTYLYGLGPNRRTLPALSLVTATNNLFGKTGIMEFNPRNTTEHGPAWERPVSVEYLRTEDNGGFQINAGLRLQGGGYIRGIYNYKSSSLPESKYSFRLYFRGEYGEGRLHYPLFPNTTADSFDTIVLRAGMNDPSNPFLKDEFARQLGSDMGQPNSHGTFVHLFLNGVYKGYYNPTERIDVDFLRAYEGGGEVWDVSAQIGEVREGDGAAWKELLTLAEKRPATNQANYLEFVRRIDLTNFIDYLLPNIYMNTDDWPHNNWRAAREHIQGGRWRFYMWDAEFSFGQPGGQSTSFNTITHQLSSLNPPWGTTEIQRLFNALKRNREFQMLFADRVHRAFFNNGPLTDARIRARYEETKARLNATRTITGFNNSMINSWINTRRLYVLDHLGGQRFNASTNAPVLSQTNGAVPAGATLGLSNLRGSIYFTTDGTDPRVPFTESIAPTAHLYTQPLVLTEAIHLKARSLEGTTNWSALTEGTFQIAQMGTPLRFSEIMYNPPGGEAYEFIELLNVSAAPLDVSDFSLEGVTFRFPNHFPTVPGGGRVLLVNGANPKLFANRYPGIPVAGYYSGSLSNGGERLAILDRNGRVIESVSYGDGTLWPAAADGEGASLERIQLNGDPDAPASWHASSRNGGTPGESFAAIGNPTIRLSEISAQPTPDPDWLEIENAGNTTADLSGWSLTDDGDLPRKFVLPNGSTVPPGGFLLVAADSVASGAKLTAPFSLNSQGETVALLDPRTNVVDILSFGPQASGFTTARLGAQGEWSLGEPTPGARNEAASLGDPHQLVLNELLADSETSDDWLEIHNPSAVPVRLTGSFLSTSNAVFRIAAPAFVGPGGFAWFHADEKSGPNHVDFKLSATGGMLVLQDETGGLINRVDYGPQTPLVSYGRWPDGTGSWTALPFSASPGASNYLAALGSTIQLTEIMAANSGSVKAPDGQPADWVELQNVSAEPVDLASFTLTLEGAPAWTFPTGTRLPAGARMVIWATLRKLPFGALNLGRELPDEGGTLVLADDRGRVRDQIRFGFQLANGVIGRTSEGWAALSVPTPGGENAARLSLASPSAVRFNEWLAQGEFADPDWIELYNADTSPVDLSGCYVTDDPSLSGTRRFQIAPLSFIAGQGFVRLWADRDTETGPDHLNFQLHPLGETLRLYSVSSGLIDQIDFAPQAVGISEGRLPDGSSRIKRLPRLSPLVSNSASGVDLDGDGLPDDWEYLHGLNPDDPSDGTQDPDRDGWTNAQEFSVGTDPQDATSRFWVEADVQGDPVQLRFLAVAGRSYSVVYRSSLQDNADWRKLTDVPAGSATQVRALSLPSPSGPSGTGFYRVVTPALP